MLGHVEVRRRLDVRLWSQQKGGWVRHEPCRVGAHRWILELVSDGNCQALKWTDF